MKRMITAAAILLTVLLACNIALASMPLTDLYDSAWNLLFDTHNVTLNVRADFQLNGALIKEITGFHMQANDLSLRELTFRTPQDDGRILETGYTVATDQLKVTATESYSPKRTFTYYIEPETTILNRTTGMDTITKLMRALVQQADAVWGKRTAGVTDQSGCTTISLELTEDDLPDAVHPALMLLSYQAAERYYGFDFSSHIIGQSGRYEYYLTPTIGLLYCTTAIRLERASLTVTLDSIDRLSSLDASLDFQLMQNSGYCEALTVHCSLCADDYDATNPAQAKDASLQRWHVGNQYIPIG